MATETFIFRGGEYVVCLNCDDSSLEVEVEDRGTADQWRGTFDSAYVEDLTHKTGNYKQFSIFVSMLESALKHSSDSVTLDLLTYSDLEALRSRKGGQLNKTAASSRPTSLTSKRYLILTYAVEFDRIHYPLPLSYVGKPDPRALQETIRSLKQEIKRLSSPRAHRKGSLATSEYNALRKDYDLLLQEKEDIEAEFIQYKREIQATTKGSAAKEVRVLKGIVKNLEQEMVQEKAKYQRIAAKRKQENQELLSELDDLKASERNLKARIKSLTNELALYRKRGRSSKAQPDPLPRSRPPTTAKSSIRRESMIRSAPTSRENSYSKDTSRLSRFSSRPRSTSRDRLFENSWESARSARSDRSASRDRSRERKVDSFRSFRSRSPSPSGGARTPRFDPTSYVREKERRKEEARLKKKREARSNRSGSREGRARAASTGSYRGSRPSSVGSNRSRASSIESLTDIGNVSDGSQSSYGRRKVLRTAGYRARGTGGKVLSSTPETSRVRGRTDRAHGGRGAQGGERGSKENRPPPSEDNEYFNRSAEMSEIDARLNRLQQFMKSNLQ